MNTVRIERENIRCKLNTHNTTTGICQFSCVHIAYVQYFMLAFLFTLKPTSLLVFHSALENLQGLTALFSRLPPAIQTAACFSFYHTIHAVHPSGPTGAIRASRSALIAVAVITIHAAALQSFECVCVSNLHDVFDDGLVDADLGELQPGDVLSHPGDEGELGPFAHGVAGGDPHEGEQASVVWGGR